MASKRRMSPTSSGKPQQKGVKTSSLSIVPSQAQTRVVSHVPSPQGSQPAKPLYHHSSSTQAISTAAVVP